MRYIITSSQLHMLIYKYLDSIFSKKDFRIEPNPYVKDSRRIDMFDDNGNERMSYFWFGPGTDDDDNPHNGIGSLHINPTILDSLRTMFSIRESKIKDIIADWVSERFNTDVDEIDIHPSRNKTPNY